MAWAAVAVGGLSLAGGIMGGRSAKKSQKQAIALQQQTLAFNKQRYADAQNLYGDTIRKMVDGAEAGVKADLQGVSDRAAGDIAAATAGAQEAAMRTQQRMGINPNSGRADSMLRQTNLAAALAKAGSVTTARENERRTAEQQTWNRRRDVSGLGISQMNSTAGDVNNATSSLAGTYSNMAQQQQQQANALISGGGQMLGGALGGLKFPAPTPSAPTGTPMANLPSYQASTGLNAPSPVIQSAPMVNGMSLSMPDAMNLYLGGR